MDPVWSPDGRHIAYVREPYLNAYREEEVWFIALSSGEERRLARGGYPRWSRDPGHLFYHSRSDNMVYSIAVDDPDAKPAPVIRSQGWYPGISPDEKYVAYAVGRTLHVIEISTGKRTATRSAPTPEPGMLVQWSADGREVSVGGFDLSSLGLWVFEVESQKAWEIFDGSVSLGVWSPDRTRFAFDVRGPFWEIWMAEIRPDLPTAQALPPVQTKEEHLRGLREKLDRAIEADPEDRIAFHRRGHLREALGDGEGAAEDFSASLCSDPDNADLYFVRAAA